MASRSTRRRLKNPEMPKLDNCQNEEDLEENQSTIGRRRSLRHSPSTSSLSPPLKARRIKESPNAHETKNIKSPTKSPKSPIKPFYNEIKELRDESNQDVSVESVATRKSTRHGPVVLNSSPTKMTRNNSVPSISPTKKNAGGRTANLSESTSVSPRRNTRSKANSPCDKEVDFKQNLKDDLVIKPRKGRLAPNTTTQEENSVQVPSTSVGCKRNLTHSPEVLAETKNGTSCKPTSPKRKCLYHSPEHEISKQTNGKIEIELDESKGNKLKNLHKNSDKESVSSDSTSSILINNSSPSLSSAFDNRLNQLSDVEVVLISHVKDEEGKDSNKRRFSNDSSESEAKLKKSKYNEVSNISQPSKSTCLSEKIQSNAQTASTIDKKLVKSIERSLTAPIDGSTSSEMMDTYSNAESLLLKEFTLTESQCNEICNILSSGVQDCSHVVIVEELVKKLLKESTSISSMSSPRFNKFLRQLLIKYCNFDTSVEKKHHLCESALVWSKERKSVNLRHELELALMTLYYNTGFYRKAEEMATGLYKETKKLQDKEKTVKACLCLSKAYHAMGNISKARANITTAKTEALKIYTPPDLQGELDLQSGIMQVAEEKDMETAFSYFKEAATGFTVRANRSRALKYMLLTKLLLNRPDDGEKAVRSQCHVEDIDKGVEAMLSITKAAVSCSLAEFKKAREQYGKELEDDLVVIGVLDQLYCKMLEKNLLNIIAPYERMQISVVAEKIGLGREEVERRLSQMILDGQISAQLDHRDDCLYVYRGEGKDQVYENAIDSISQFDRTLSLLNRRIKQLL